MRSKFLLAMALVMVIAAGFATIGMAYTASTDNSGNTASSDYVVLTQTNYTLTNNSSLIIDAVTMPVGTFYQLPCSEDLFTYEGRHYCGVKVGDSDTLEAEAVGTERTVIPIKVETFYTGSGLNISTNFTDYSESSLSWRYVIKVEVADTGDTPDDLWTDVPSVQYLYYDGNNKPDSDGRILWKVLAPGATIGQFEDAESNSLQIVEGAMYRTSLYLAGIAHTVADGSVFRLAESAVVLDDNATVKPFWIKAGNRDFKNTLKSGDSGILGQLDRILHVGKGTNLVVPGNQFNSSQGKVFVGWLETSTGVYYYPGEIFSNFDGDRIFVAQWSSSGYKTMTFSDGIQNSEESLVLYYDRAVDRFTFPMNSFTNPDGSKKFAGWKDTDTEIIYQPGESLRQINEDRNFEAVWVDKGSSKTVTFSGTINHTSASLVLYTETDGSIRLPNNMFGPVYELPEGEGWKFAGWFVKEGGKTGRLVAQDVTSPDASGPVIIHNGTIKFVYENNEDLQESEDQGIDSE